MHRSVLSRRCSATGGFALRCLAGSVIVRVANPTLSGGAHGVLPSRLSSHPEGIRATWPIPIPPAVLLTALPRLFLSRYRPSTENSLFAGPMPRAFHPLLWTANQGRSNRGSRGSSYRTSCIAIHENSFPLRNALPPWALLHRLNSTPIFFAFTCTDRRPYATECSADRKSTR